MAEEKKKRYYYYGGKEKSAEEVKGQAERGLAPYPYWGMRQNFENMIEAFEREFDDFWRFPLGRRGRMGRMGGFPMMPLREMPLADLEDRGADFRLAVDLPGFKKEDVDIEIGEDWLTVKAQKTEEKEETKGDFIRKERAGQSFYRRVALPEEINADETKANLADGVLEVILPKKQPKKTKKLKIK